MNELDDDVLDLTVPQNAAAFWVIERDKGVNLDESQAFANWLAASEKHAVVWRDALAVWDRVEGAKDPLLAAMRKEALSARPMPRHATPWLKVAAVLAVFVVGTAIGWRFWDKSASPGGPNQLVSWDARPTFAADASGPSTFTLGDGSIVTLAANSAIAVQYNAQVRAVRLLHGHAYFSVAHDSGRPFSTDIGTSTIIDRGTEFDAQIDGNKVSVTLISGGLSIASPGHDQTVLQPGQNLEAEPGKEVRVTAISLEATTAWRTGFLEFSDEPLESAISQINRYGAPAIKIADASVRTIKVSGRFRTGNPARFARALGDMYPLRMIERPDGGVDIAAR